MNEFTPLPTDEAIAERLTECNEDDPLLAEMGVSVVAVVATNAVMSLLAVPDEHRVLWETKTLELSTRSRTQSMITHRVFDLPPGTRVRVVADVD